MGSFETQVARHNGSAGRFGPDAQSGALILAERAHRRSQRDYRELVDALPQAIFEADESLRVTLANRSAADCFGYTREDVDAGLSITRLVSPADLERFRRGIDRVLGGEELEGRELELVRKDGSRFPAIVNATPVTRSGSVVGLRGTVVDITERKRMEDALKASETAYRAIFDAANDAIFVHDAETFAVLDVNQKMTEMFGFTREEVRHLDVTTSSEGDPEQVRQQAWWRLTAAAASEPQLFEWLARDKAGRPFWVEVNLKRAVIGGQERLLAVVRDISERKRHQDQLAFLAAHDPLTNLPNRRSLEAALGRAIGRVNFGATSVLLFLDVDNFKVVNDTAGHIAGDRVLVALAQLLRERLRGGDLLARVGGDEFAVLLEDTSVEGALAVAERMRQSVDECDFTADDHTFHLGLSIGLVLIDTQCKTGVVLSQADAAMYRAKEQGRNRIVVYRPDEDDLAQLSEANRWAARLRDALRRGLFMLHYQPVVRLEDRQVDHYEALLRLRGQSGRVVLPAAFVPAAEQFGLMPEITRWVVQEAVRRLQAHPGARTFVNLSADCLVDDGLLDFVEARLDESGIEPGRLGFEITETTIVQDLALAERWVRRLKARGCRFALDDFGSGFSSFVHLRNLPVDHLKIDGAITRALQSDATERAVVQAMQVLARTLGKEIVAEWVENEATVRILREIGVAHGQGYHLGRPGPLTR